MNPESDRQGTVGPRGVWAEVDLFPDGSTIAATRHTAAETALWLLDAERGNPTRLSASSTPIAWSPDGARIAFSKAEGTPPNSFVVDVVEGGEPRRLTTTPRAAYPTGWTPGGEQWVLTVGVGGGASPRGAARVPAGSRDRDRSG